MLLSWFVRMRRCSDMFARAIFLAVVLLCLPGLRLGTAHAEDAGSAPATPSVPRSAVTRGFLADKIYVEEPLPDGRLAVIGKTTREGDGLLRILDPKTGAEEIYDIEGSGNFKDLFRAGPTVAIAGDAVYAYGHETTLLRASKPGGKMSDVDIGAAAEADMSSGAIVADGKSVLVSWWDSNSDGECGGAIVARLSSDGKVIWRWREKGGRYDHPNDMVVMADGTIVVLLEGDAIEYMGTMWNPCVHGWETLVALSADGHEIAERRLPRAVWLGPLSLGWNGKEVIAPAGFDVGYRSGLGAIMRISVQGGQIRIDQIDVQGDLANVPYAYSVTTSLETGGFRLMSEDGLLLIFDQQGHVAQRSAAPPSGLKTYGYKAVGNRGLVCPTEDAELILPLR